MSRYLVLGGNGFIGKKLVERLSMDNQVVVADYNVDVDGIVNGIEYKKIDFCSCTDFSPYLENIDIVIHLISTIVPNDNTDNINKDISDNVFPTITLLDNMKNMGVNKILFVSSGGTVYGEHSTVPISEVEKTDPICNYGIIKDIIEKYLRLYNHYYDLDYRVVRLANPYSGEKKSSGKQGIIPIFIDQILNEKPIRIFGDGSAVRDYIYIDDAIDSMIKVLNYTGENRIFNVGTGIGFSQNELLSIIKNTLEIDNIDVEYTNNRLCDVKNNVLSIDMTKKELDWEPKVTLEEGIHRIIDSKRRITNGQERNK